MIESASGAGRRDRRDPARATNCAGSPRRPGTKSHAPADVPAHDHDRRALVTAGRDVDLSRGPVAVLCAGNRLAAALGGRDFAGFHCLPPLGEARAWSSSRAASGPPKRLHRGAPRTSSTRSASTSIEVGDAPGLVLGRIVCQLINEAAFAAARGRRLRRRTSTRACGSGSTTRAACWPGATRSARPDCLARSTRCSARSAATATARRRSCAARYSKATTELGLAFPACPPPSLLSSPTSRPPPRISRPRAARQLHRRRVHHRLRHLHHDRPVDRRADLRGREAGAADVDAAVAAARAAFEAARGASCPGIKRGELINKLADLIEENADELAQLESLDNGKPVKIAQDVDVAGSVATCATSPAGRRKIEGRDDPGRGAGHVRLHAARAGRRLRPDHPVELPAADGRLEDRARRSPPAAPSCSSPPSRRRSPRCASASSPLEAGFPPGVAQRRHRRRRHRRRAGRAPGRRQDRLHRLDRRRPRDRREGRPRPQARHARARRQVAEHHLRRTPTCKAAIGGSFQGIYFNTGQACNAGSRLFVQRRSTTRSSASSPSSPPSAVVGPGARRTARTFGPRRQRSSSSSASTATSRSASTRAPTPSPAASPSATDGGYFIHPTLFTGVDPTCGSRARRSSGRCSSARRSTTSKRSPRAPTTTSTASPPALWTRDVGQRAQARRAARVGHGLHQLLGPGRPGGPVRRLQVLRASAASTGAENLDAYLETKTVWTSLVLAPAVDRCLMATADITILGLRTGPDSHASEYIAEIQRRLAAPGQGRLPTARHGHFARGHAPTTSSPSPPSCTRCRSSWASRASTRCSNSTSPPTSRARRWPTRSIPSAIGSEAVFLSGRSGQHALPRRADRIRRPRSRALPRTRPQGRLRRRSQSSRAHLADALKYDIPRDMHGIDVGPYPTPADAAELLAAESFGAKQTWFLTNGATQGNHALALALAPLGAPRRRPAQLARLGRRRAGAQRRHPGVRLAARRSRPADRPRRPARGPRAARSTRTRRRAVFIVSPTYYGTCADVAALAQIAHCTRHPAAG